MERPGDRGGLGVDERRQQAYALADHLIDTGSEAGPKRSNGAGASDDGG